MRRCNSWHRTCPLDVRPSSSRNRDQSTQRSSQWLAEAVATFTLVLAILGGLRYSPSAIPWLVGLVITAAYWFTASTSFANPAVTLARGFTTTFAGIAMNHVPAFIIAQLIGAAVAAVVSAQLFPSPARRSAQALARANSSIRCWDKADVAHNGATVYNSTKCF